MVSATSAASATQVGLHMRGLSEVPSLYRQGVKEWVAAGSSPPDFHHLETAACMETPLTWKPFQDASLKASQWVWQLWIKAPLPFLAWVPEAMVWSKSWMYVFMALICVASQLSGFWAQGPQVAALPQSPPFLIEWLNKPHGQHPCRCTIAAKDDINGVAAGKDVIINCVAYSR